VREAHRLLGAEEDEAGRERGAPARGQTQAEPEEAARSERQQEELVVTGLLEGPGGRESSRSRERADGGR